VSEVPEDGRGQACLVFVVFWGSCVRFFGFFLFFFFFFFFWPFLNSLSLQLPFFEP